MNAARFAKPDANRFRKPEPEIDEDEIDGHGQRHDDGSDLPTPFILAAKARRFAGIAEAKAVLAILPQPGESLHAICTKRMDLTDIISGIIGKLGPVSTMRVATLGYNNKNLRTMLDWCNPEDCKVKSLWLLTSHFFQSHQRGLFEETLGEFSLRGKNFGDYRAAAGYSHAKVVTMLFANGQKWTTEGSANLNGNGSGREQVMICQDAGLHDWHRTWIEQMVSKHAPR